MNILKYLQMRFDIVLYYCLVLCTTLVSCQYNRRPGTNPPLPPQARPPNRGGNNNGPNIMAEWQQMSYEFPSKRDEQTAIANGNVVVSNAVPIDVQPHYGKTLN